MYWMYIYNDKESVYLETGENVAHNVTQGYAITVS